MDKTREQLLERAKVIYSTNEAYFNEPDNIINNQVDIKANDQEFHDICVELNMTLDDLIYKVAFEEV